MESVMSNEKSRVGIWKEQGSKRGVGHWAAYMRMVGKGGGGVLKNRIS